MKLGTTFRRAMATLVAIGSCWAGSSWAIPVVWTDSEGGLDRLITPDNPYHYQHDITGGPNGYVPGVDTIYDASLSIWLYDDAFFGDWPILGDGEETVGFSFDGSSWISSTVDSLFFSLDNFDFTVTSLVTDGVLDVTVKSYRGDFAFAGSRLTVVGDSRAVPEPATLALFGFGLLGVGAATGMRRRKASTAK